MENNRYITNVNGFKMLVRVAYVNDFRIEICESYEKIKADLLLEEKYEELIELEKLTHFDLKECMNFWDGFDLYSKVLEAKNK